MGFHFVPSGAYPSYTAGMYLFWRRLPPSQIDYSKEPYSPTGWMEKEKACKIWAGDREFLLCSDPKWIPHVCDNSWDGCFDTNEIYNGDWDKVSAADPFQQEWKGFHNSSMYQANGMGEHCGLKYTMIAAHNGMKMGIKDRDFLQTDRIKLIADSGGAQIKLSVIGYVDPHEVIDWMNKVADYGVTLDICPRPVDCIYDDIVDGCADIQLRHNKMLLEKRRPDLKLINVIHGHTFRQQLAWWEKTRVPGFIGWAAGADSFFSVLSWLRSFMIPIAPTLEAIRKGRPLPEDSELFHLFGVSGRSAVPGLAWLSHYVPELTIDSTAWLMSVKTRTMEVLTPQGNLRTVAVGGASNGLGIYSPLPCNCPICSIIGYGFVYHLPAKLRIQGLLATHNWLTYARYVNLWGDLAKNSTYKEFIKNLDARLGKPSKSAKKQEKVSSVFARYIECVAQNGLKAGEHEFAHYLTNEEGKTTLEEGAISDFEPIDFDTSKEAKEQTLKTMEAKKDKEYYKKVAAMKPSSYYHFDTKGDVAESASVFVFPYYFTHDEIKTKNYPTYDRIVAMNYANIAPIIKDDPKFLKRCPDFLKLVKTRRFVYNKATAYQKAGGEVPIVGFGPWLKEVTDAEDDLYKREVQKDKKTIAKLDAKALALAQELEADDLNIVTDEEAYDEDSITEEILSTEGAYERESKDLLTDEENDTDDDDNE